MLSKDLVVYVSYIEHTKPVITISNSWAMFFHLHPAPVICIEAESEQKKVEYFNGSASIYSSGACAPRKVPKYINHRIHRNFNCFTTQLTNGSPYTGLQTINNSCYTLSDVALNSVLLWACTGYIIKLIAWCPADATRKVWVFMAINNKKGKRSARYI